MNRTPAQWAALSPSHIAAGPVSAAMRTLADALADIAELAAENARLQTELATARRVATMRLVEAIEGVRADGAVS